MTDALTLSQQNIFMEMPKTGWTKIYTTINSNDLLFFLVNDLICILNHDAFCETKLSSWLGCELSFCFTSLSCQFIIIFIVDCDFNRMSMDINNNALTKIMVAIIRRLIK